MTTGPCYPRVTAAGFTLVEILLVLAVIALLGTLLLPGVDSLLRSISGEDPDRIAWDAITAAREQALTTNRTVWLRCDPKRSRLAWSDGTDGRSRDLPPDTTLQFLQPQVGSSILLGGVLLEDQTVPAVRFYPDGTCDRFRVQIRRGAAALRQISVDPWTCAPFLAPAGQ